MKNNLDYYRHKHGLSMINLAKKAGVRRNAIYDMETGAYMPNTEIALKLAGIFGVGVEDLFQLDPADVIQVMEPAELLPSGAEDMEGMESYVGLPVQVCEVEKRLVAMPPQPPVWELQPADAVLLAVRKCGGKAEIQILDYAEKMFQKRLLIAGSDPGVSVLLRQLRRNGVDAVAIPRNGTQALDLLEQSMVHVAGLRIKDEATGEYNLHVIRERFPKGTVSVASYAFREAGIVIARGNPKGIMGIEDLAREDVRIVNREAGSGVRETLDSWLKKHDVPARDIAGYETVETCHMSAAWQVKNGAADCCLAVKAAACAFGLDFITLERERYDLVIRKRNLDNPGVRALLNVLCLAAFRRELEGLGGYDASISGNPLVRGITFTGSTDVGRRINRNAAANFTKVQLEMGGKNPSIVADYKNLDKAADELASAAYALAGQRCTSISRVIVLNNQADEFENLLAEKTTGNFTVGNGMNPDVNIGPIMNDKAGKDIMSYIQGAKDEGATIRAGGNQLTGGIYDKGFYIEPTLITNVTPKMKVAIDEIFGPVLAVIRVNTFDEALEVANDTKYGLSASVFTDNLRYIYRFAQEIESGMAHINHGTVTDGTMPFGGVKGSGLGQFSKGKTNKDFFTQLKVVYTKYL